MSLPTKIRFDKQEIENIRLPIGSYQTKKWNTTLFQPLSSWGNTDECLNMTTNWTNAFLWQQLGQLKFKDIEAIDEINNIDPKDEIAKERLEVLSKNMSKQFNKIKEQISNLEILDEAKLEEIQNQISKIAQKNSINKIATLEEKIDIINYKIDILLNKLGFEIEKPSYKKPKI